MIKQWQLRLIGVVQGVFMRDSVHKKAVNLGLRGFVRNLPGGSVEIVAAGELDSLKQLLTWLELSPGSSEINRIDKEERDQIEIFDDFKIMF